MKSIKLLFLAIFIFSSFSEIAEGQILFAAKGGANLTKGAFEQETTNYALKYHFGFFSQISFSNKVGLRVELLYSKKGWRIPNDALNNNISITLSYLNLPVLVDYEVSKRLTLFAGSELGYKLSEARNPKGSVPDYEKIDLGLTLGTSYVINSKIGVDLRYVLGFKGLINENVLYTDIYGNTTTRKLKDGSNRTIMLGIFYLFNNPK